MLAAVRTDLGVIAVHRTFLDPAEARLADFERPKRALGSLQNGDVRLTAPRDGRLGLAEGIETALSAMQMFGVPCWATLGNERFGLVAIPESVRELHLFVDNDRGGDLAEEYYVAGQVRVVKITPKRGPVYYLVDSNGDGILDSSKGEGSVSPVQYKLFGW